MDKCTNKPNKPACYSDDAINNYIRDFQIDTWSLQERMDFSLFDQRPVFYTMELLMRDLLDRDKTKYIDLMIQLNEIETSDDPISPGTPTFEGFFY